MTLHKLTQITSKMFSKNGFFLVRESLRFAVGSLRVNKLRTILSLLGITIGIFAIISVLTVVSSLEKNIREGIDALGDDIIYIQKWPWGTGGEYPWWKYLKRPVPTLREYQYLKKNLNNMHDAAFMLSTGTTLKYKKNEVRGAAAMAITDGYENIRSFEIIEGRFISPYEIKAGKKVVVIGSKIADQLFPDQSPIDKTVIISGNKMRVIGVFKKEGSSIIDTSLDNVAVTSVNFARTFLNIRSERLNPMIMVKPAEGISIEQISSDIQNIMRAYRRIKPREEDNFALNKISLLSNGLDSLFVVLDMAGWLIGGFSILVGGFGIANIMFVSVRDQTRIIGIQKALGAKNGFILFQFLSEAVLLSLIGGFIGLLLVFGLTLVATRVSDFAISMSFGNVLLGIFISSSIGIVSGIFPAWQASRLDPVVAMSQS